MNKNERNSLRRHSGPLQFLDLDGNGLPNQAPPAVGATTFTIYTLKDGGLWVAAGGTVAEIGGEGYYDYAYTQAETQADSYIAVRFVLAGYRSQEFRERLDPEVPSGQVVAGTLTATSFSTDLTSTDMDTFADCFITFTTGALAGQVKRIGNSTAVGLLTLKTSVGYTFTRAPAIGDRFDIIRR